MKRVDIKGGQMTFGERIQLGRILSNKSLSEYEKFKASMILLDDAWTIAQVEESIEYFHEVVGGILYWIKREKTDLVYKPTAEELIAGIETLSVKVGEMATISALAKDFGQDPDDVLGWKYGKVFNILYTNLEAYHYRVRLEKRLNDKHRKKK